MQPLRPHPQARLCAGFLVLALATLPGAARAAIEVPMGTSSFTFADARGRVDRPMTVYSHRPAQCRAECPIQFVMHGNSREAKNYRDYWIQAADTHGFIVLAPEFSRQNWPGSRSYNQGDVAASPDPSRWSYSAVEHLFDEVRGSHTHYRIFGHSAGAQFVHRLLALLPDNRVNQAVIANAGWYTLPEWRADRVSYSWPHSLHQSRTGEAGARALLGKPVLLMLGENDVDPNDPDLDQAPGSRAQGRNRLERGQHFLQQALEVGASLGLTLPWRLVRVPETGHSGKGMSEAAARELYAQPPNAREPR